ncbi:DNA polymerase III subunit gamma/tau [Novosphingobium marinum]|uniref:DNA polymerase III subunit gamma/tau n=1 Tax=Novosphingobium marinum TaxID=1514948 RepID=A0A7Y9Y0N8_9SPHN|nr:DNA polymerase III subunit gamma/tau [Novosphingobium marinum]NYH96583.1 DNA polymerase-3 subunit gamma/tau [Novosphingobium marinum]GGC36354.1 DNA polymerase III subunit gamma/tau [Novosphingobium marinum]
MSDSNDMFGNAAPDDEGDDEAGDSQPSAGELEAAGQSALFGGDEVASDPPAVDAVPDPAPVQPPATDTPSTGTPVQPYRVLARKYRPQTFGELIGQEAMVRTLANAIRRNRLAHAFLMTGVRGVGKTSTARLIAKALNCIGPDGQGGPTIDPCGMCEPCVAIAEGRHIDVIEMDAASHTGVDDVREIIEAVRYAAVSARYKIYIIDEVHMLSRNAFNALLKTLEEPPAHVKFLFATTEADKLPVTVLSRCQRFDLRRIPAPMLAGHFEAICDKEDVEAEDEALAMIAAAAEGSVRDGLSILDQAIAHADMDAQGRVTAAQVRDMLGLADNTAQRDLFDAVLNGEGARLLELVDRQFSLGVEPLALLRGAMGLTHRITVAQIAGNADDIPSVEERTAIEGWSQRLTAAQLHRLWQLLLKGFEEVRMAPDPLVAARMALLRVMHASDMPDPGTLAKKLASLPADAPAPATNAAPAPAASDTPPWNALVDRIEDACGIGLAERLRFQVRVVDFAPGRFVYSQAPGISDDPTQELRRALETVLGGAWTVERVEEGGAPTLVEQDEAEKKAQADAIRQAPIVAAAFAAFPDAEMIEGDSRAAAGGGNRNWRR